MPPERSTRAGILPGCSSLGKSKRDAEVKFEPRTFRSLSNLPVILCRYFGHCDRILTVRTTRLPTSIQSISVSHRRTAHSFCPHQPSPMVDISDDRHFTNPFDAWDERFKVDNEWKRSLSENILGLVNKLSEEASNLSSSDISMYTGLAGIGLFFLKLSRAPAAFVDHDAREDARSLAQKITRRCLRHLDTDRFHKNVSVFTSSVGALCLAALDETDSASAEKYLEQILTCAKFACNLNSSMPDEALYGRSGYINALLTLGRENRQIPADVLARVVDAILQSGLRTAKRYQSDGIYQDLMRHSNLAMPPLMYEWHDKTYLGGAHGFAGILLTLIKVHQLYPNALSDKSMRELVLPTVHWMGELQMSSGNWPSSLGRSMGNDVLVHWCHGATGVVPLMLAAYQLTGDKAFLTRAIRGGEAIWARGLLYKGCGLCHGSAGSGYALLDLHRVTKDPKYLYKAAKFAEWCTDCFKNRTRVADRPYSLFEGLAGTLYFLVDILEPSEARFPLLSAP